MFKKHILFVICLFYFVFANAQQKIVGKVSDKQGKAIENVSIGSLNMSKQIGTITNSKGEYSLNLNANVEYKIRFSCIGFKDFDTIIRLQSLQNKTIDVILENAVETLDAIEVKGDYSREDGVTRISTEWAKNVAGPTGGVENVIKSTEGVSSNNELSSQYSVRGGNFDENLVYVNDIEINRPLLIRNGQQEGLSFINTDMIGDIQFSSGGFDAQYGDKMSSVLDIKYKKPREFSGNASIGLLGGSAHVEGLIGSRFTYQLGYRNKTSSYLLNSLETQGDYNTTFNDLQTYLTYDINEKMELAFLGNVSDNKYNFVPQTRETQFGNIYQTLNLRIYFDGEELDRFTSLFGAFMFTYKPKKDLQLKFISSAFSTNESESYDIQGQYWLYETGGLGSEEEFDRGIGTYLEHARNNLNANIFNLEHKGYKYYDNGLLSWGVKYQREHINDGIREWKMVDSSDYTIPSIPDGIGVYDGPNPPMLQNFYRSHNDISTNRLTAFAQRQFTMERDKGTFFFNLGVRGQYWDFNNEFFPSPRVSMSFKPNIKQDIMFRCATGIYAQFPFFKEYRDEQGDINKDIKSQKSWHMVLSSDWNFKMLDRNFKFVTSAYYKYLWDIIPYHIDNVRIRYTAQNNAIGYVAGLDMKLFGEFVKGIDSWLTLSIMKTEQDIEGDGQGYLPRPTDQLINASVSFQDYLPNMPWMRVYLNFNYGSGYPYYPPNSTSVLRMPNYLRADIAFTFRIKDEEASWAKGNFMKFAKRIWLNLEWLNVFDTKNVISYMYVQDFAGVPYPVPNYLTPSRLNAKLTVEF